MTVTVDDLAAASVMAAAPVVILFVALQRFVVGALTSGTVEARAPRAALCRQRPARIRG